MFTPSRSVLTSSSMRRASNRPAGNAAPSPRPGHSLHRSPTAGTPFSSSALSPAGGRPASAGPRRAAWPRSAASASSPVATAPQTGGGYYWLERPPRPWTPSASAPRKTGGGGEVSDSSYSAKHAHRSIYESSRMSASLLAEAAKFEAEAWALQEQEQQAVHDTMVYWTRQVDKQVVQAENHRLAEKVVDLTEALMREREHASRETESLRAQLQRTEEDARIARVTARLHARDGTYDRHDRSHSLLWK